MKNCSRIKTGVIEANCQCEQINCERKDPKQGHYCDVLADLVRGGEKQQRTARSAAEPKDALSEAGNGFSECTFVYAIQYGDRRDKSILRTQSAVTTKQGETTERREPYARLNPERQPGLN